MFVYLVLRTESKSGVTIPCAVFKDYASAVSHSNRRLNEIQSIDKWKLTYPDAKFPEAEGNEKPECTLIGTVKLMKWIDGRMQFIDYRIWKEPVR